MAAEQDALKGMKYKLECVQNEKAAGDGAALGLILLPLCTWGLYKCMEPTGELDGPAKLAYVVAHIGPTILMQWFLFEAMAKIRIAKAKAGKCPHPWEPDGRLGGGKPTPEGIDALNPSFYALWNRACQNNFESTVLNTLAIMCLSMYCGGAMYDARLAVALGYMHAIGGFVYAGTYAFMGPNHRMYGFIFRGFWQNGASALFCCIRSTGLFAESAVTLFWVCSAGLPLVVMILIVIVKKKYHGQIPEGQIFGYSFEELQAWIPKDVESGGAYKLTSDSEE